MKTLYYIHDPMCSWCYAFSDTFNELIDQLPSNIDIKYICGGLAPNSNEPMPLNMRKSIQNIWYDITARVGTKFNHDFWILNTPRRSTYLSCQACVSARVQNKEKKMIKEIQKAYYLNAKNPSNGDILIQCANNINLDIEKFKNDLYSNDILEIFQNDLTKRKELNIYSFPSLVLQIDNEINNIDIQFNNSNKILENILKY